MYGVETTIVRPASLRRPSRSQNSRRETASTPVVGSSRNRISGRWTSAQQSASFCFMPPDSAPARRSLNGSSCAVDRRDVLVLALDRRAEHRGEERAGSPRRSGRDRARSGRACSRSRCRSAQKSRTTSWPSTVRRARVGHEQRREDAEERRLAGAVRADEAEELAACARRTTRRRAPSSGRIA